MAKIKYMFASDIRGKQGGTIYSKGIGGSYIKNWAQPSNPQSSSQIVARQRLSTLAAAWRELTEAQREAWIAAASDYPAQNVFGDTYEASGYQVYMTLNSNLAAAGATTLSVPAAPASLTDTVVTATEFSLTAGVLTIGTVTLSATTVSGENVIVEATAPLSAGVNSPASSKFKQVYVESTATDEFDIEAGYVSIYGSPAVGQKVFVRCYIINTTTGQRQLIGKASTIVVTV